MKKKILIVDDELFFRAMLKKNLQGNFDIIEGANGHEAVSLCREKLPDLIILDIEMPVCDGIEACKILKADPATRKIPVILFTSRTRKKDMVLGLKLAPMTTLPNRSTRRNCWPGSMRICAPSISIPTSSMKT